MNETRIICVNPVLEIIFYAVEKVKNHKNGQDRIKKKKNGHRVFKSANCFGPTYYYYYYNRSIKFSVPFYLIGMQRLRWKTW